jgi:hypothetical protein
VRFAFWSEDFDAAASLARDDMGESGQSRPRMISAFEHAVLCLFLDEVLQPEYVHTSFWLDSE